MTFSLRQRRAHWNKRQGREKFGYDEARARRLAEMANSAHPDLPRMSAYRCAVCDRWHYGRVTNLYPQIRRAPDHLALMIEVGARATAHLMRQNRAGIVRRGTTREDESPTRRAARAGRSARHGDG